MISQPIHDDAMATTKLESTSVDARRDWAISYCREQQRWYMTHKHRARRSYQIAKILTIIMSAIAPLLILTHAVSPIIQAIPPALAGIATSISSAFNWHNNWVRFGAAAMSLELALVGFETRGGELYDSNIDDEEALRRFVSQVIRIVGEEAKDWRSELQNGPDEQTSPKGISGPQ
jgi:Protein of unknown function (DUF4231)